jgi:hypothetical protein
MGSVAQMRDQYSTLVSHVQDGWGLGGGGDHASASASEQAEASAVLGTIREHCDGTVLVPTLVNLVLGGVFEELKAQGGGAAGRPVALSALQRAAGEDEDALPCADFLPCAVRCLAARGWLSVSGGAGSAGAGPAAASAESVQLTPTGESLAERWWVNHLPVGYFPTYAAMGELLFGDPAAPFALGSGGRERHVNRFINLAGSSTATKAWLRAAGPARDTLEATLHRLFTAPPLHEQPM